MTELSASRHAYTYVLILTLAALANVALAQEFTFEVHAGTSAHLPNTIHVHQSGHEPVSVRGATYTTRAFSHLDSLLGLSENYYSVRVGYYPQAARPHAWDYGVELELLHDKVYYESGHDPGGIIQHFELSDGLNQLLFNVAARYPLLPDPRHPTGRLHLIARAGLGPVITAPATIIRGQQSGTRTHMAPEAFYAFGGPGAQASAQLRYYLAPFAALSLEAKVTIAHARVPIAGGYANATYHGAHVNFGMAFQAP